MTLATRPPAARKGRIKASAKTRTPVGSFDVIVLSR